MAKVPLPEYEGAFLVHFHVGEMSFLPGNGSTEWRAGAKRSLCLFMTLDFSTRKKRPDKGLFYDFLRNSEMSGSSPFKMRLVHLDLKGAPPKVSYLSEVRAPSP